MKKGETYEIDVSGSQNLKEKGESNGPLKDPKEKLIYKGESNALNPNDRTKCDDP